MSNRHKIICASYLLLFNNNQVLLSRRFNTGFEDGKYSVPAGHVDEGESVTNCLIREAKEEIGITLNSNKITLRHIMHRNKTENNDERLDFFFICDEWDEEPMICEEDKCDDLRWFDLDNLPENIIPYIQTAIENTVNKKLYSELYW